MLKVRNDARSEGETRTRCEGDTRTRCRPVARPAGGGSKFQNDFFLSLARAGRGGANLEKVDKIYTRGENFSKKRSF